MACKQDESPSVVELADMLYTAIQSFDHKGKTDESTTDEELVSKNAQKLISFLEIEMEPLVPSRQWFLANKVVCELKKRSAELGSGDLEKKPYMRILNQVMKAFDRKLEAAVSSKENSEKRGKEESTAASLALAPSLSGFNQSMITACHCQQHQMQNYVNRYQQQQQQQQQPQQAQFSPQVTPNALFMQQLQQQNALPQQQAMGFGFNSFGNPMMPSLIQPFPVPLPQGEGGPDMFQNDIANPMQQTHILEPHSLAASPATNLVDGKHSEIEKTPDAGSLQRPEPKKRIQKRVSLPAVLGSLDTWQTFDCLHVAEDEITDPSYIENMICERFKDKEPQLICPRWHIRHSRLRKRTNSFQNYATKVLFNCTCKDNELANLNKSFCVEIEYNFRNAEEPQAILRWNGVEHCKEETFKFNTGETLLDAKKFFSSRIYDLLEENPDITFDKICEIFHKEHAFDQHHPENFYLAGILKIHYNRAKRIPRKKIEKKRKNVSAISDSQEKNKSSRRQGSGLDRENWQTFNLSPETTVEELTSHHYVEEIISSIFQDNEPQLICPRWHIRHSRLKMRRNTVDYNDKRLMYTCCCNYIGLQYLDKAFCVEISFDRRNAEESQKILRWNGIGHCKEEIFKLGVEENPLVTDEFIKCRVEALIEDRPGITAGQIFDIFKREHDFDSESDKNSMLAKKIKGQFYYKRCRQRFGPSRENWQTFNLPPATIVEELNNHHYVEEILCWIFQNSEPRLICPRWYIRHSRLKMRKTIIVDVYEKRRIYTCCCNYIGMENLDKAFCVEICVDHKNFESQTRLRWNGIGHCKEEIFKFDVEQNPIISYEFFKCRVDTLMEDRPGIKMKQMLEIFKKEHDFDSESDENFTLVRKLYTYYYGVINDMKHENRLSLHQGGPNLMVEHSIQPFPLHPLGERYMVDNDMPITIQQARLSNTNSVAASQIPDSVGGDDPVNPEKNTQNGNSSDSEGGKDDSSQKKKKTRKLFEILGDRVGTWQTFNFSSALNVEELFNHRYIEEMIRNNFQDEPHLICPRWHIRHSRLATRRRVCKTKVTKVLYSCSCTYIGLQQLDEAFCVEVGHDIRNAEGSQTILRWNGVGHCQEEIFKYSFDESAAHSREFFFNRMETLLEDNPGISKKEILGIFKEEHGFDPELNGNKHLAYLLRYRYYKLKKGLKKWRK